MSGLKPMVGGSGIILSGIGSATYLHKNYQSGTIISIAVYVILTLVLWGGIYHSVIPYMRRVLREK